jgi:MFS family permease
MRGASFGLRQSLDTVGAVLGPLTAMTLMVLLASNFTAVFWVATIPGFIAVAILVLGVEEPPPVTDAKKRIIDSSAIGRLGAAFWAVTAVGTVLTLARFSEAFLVLRAQNVGMIAATVPAVMAVMSLVYTLAAYPAGALSDRIGRRGVLLAGIAALVASDLVLAWASGVAGVMAGVVLWGLHMGLTQGLLAAMVADTAPAELRGTGFGLFNLAGGVAMLLASVIAGFLWDSIGPAATFVAGAAFTAASGAGLIALARRDLARHGAGRRNA